MRVITPFSCRDRKGGLDDVALLFAAESSTGGELWKSDGTVAGTVLVKDIRPGIDGSFPGLLTKVNGLLYFTADDGATGRELWKSDGTSAGTVLVKDINPGGGSAFPSAFAGNPVFMTNVNGTLFFRANDGAGDTKASAGLNNAWQKLEQRIQDLHREQRPLPKLAKFESRPIENERRAS